MAGKEEAGKEEFKGWGGELFVLVECPSLANSPDAYFSQVCALLCSIMTSWAVFLSSPGSGDKEYSADSAILEECLVKLQPNRVNITKSQGRGSAQYKVQAYTPRNIRYHLTGKPPNKETS